MGRVFLDMFDYQMVVQLLILFLYTLKYLDAAHQHSCSSLESLPFLCWIVSTLLSSSS